MSRRLDGQFAEVLLRFPTEGEMLAAKLNGLLDPAPRRYPLSSEDREFRNKLIALGLLWDHSTAVHDDDQTQVEPLETIPAAWGPRVAGHPLDNLPGMSTTEVAAARTVADVVNELRAKMRADHAAQNGSCECDTCRGDDGA